MPKTRFCFLFVLLISFAGQTLAQTNFDWVRFRNGKVPDKAVRGGGEPDQRESYVCRANYGGSLVSGKLIDDRCYFYHDRRERSSTRFEVLIGEKYYWTERNVNYDRAVVSGSDRDRNFYVCRVSDRGGQYPGYLESGRCYYSAGGRGESSRDFEVLQSEEYLYTLLTAAERGNYQALRDALRDGQAINQRNSSGRTALMIASEKGHLNIVRELLYQRASVDLTDDRGNTALMYAASVGQTEIAGLLIREGANVNTRNNDGETAFILAASGGQSRMVEDFLRNEYVGRIDRFDLESAFRAAASGGHSNVLQILFNETGVDPESRDRSGRTALLLAASNNKPETVEFLLRRNVDIGARDNRENTAFDLAVGSDAERVLRVLADLGGFKKDDPQMEKGMLAAALLDKRDSLKFLIGYGVLVDARDASNGSTPLMLAAGEGHDETTELLIRAGAGLDLQNDLGETAAILAAAKSKNNTLKELIKAGADINLRDETGRTALGWAVFNKHKDTRKTLEKAGAKQ